MNIIKTRLRQQILPFTLYALVVLIITAPLVGQLSTHVGGAEYGDSFEYLRLGWWGRYALSSGLNPFYQSLLVYPEGFLSATQIAQPLIYLPISLLGVLFGDTAAFNLWLLTILIASGWSAYLLCREMLNPEHQPPFSPAAWVGGLIFMIFPAVQGHLSAGHINPLSHYALPLVALCLWRVVSGCGGLRWALIGALSLWVLALGNFTFLVYGLLPLLLFGGVYVLLRSEYRHLLSTGHVLRDLGLMLIGGAILSLPFYLPLIQESLAADRPDYLQEGGQVRYSTDLLSFGALSPFGILKEMAPEYSRRAIGVNATEGAAYVGIGAVILSLIALWSRRRGVGLWLTILIGCMVFSLGALLKVGDRPITYHTDGRESHVVLPFALIQDLPLINVSRTPGRFNLTSGLALGVLASLGLSAILHRIPQAAVRRGVVGGLTLLIVIEYQLFSPFPTTPTTIPAYFYALAGRAEVQAVLDVPYDDPIAQKYALLYQTAHHKPLIGGYVSRRTPADPVKLRLLSDGALGRAVPFISSESMPLESDHWLALLDSADVIVVHKGLLQPSEVDQAKTRLGAVVYEDARIAVFEPAPPRSAAATLISAYGTGWLHDQDQHWMGAAGTVNLFSANTREIALNLKAHSLFQTQRLIVALDDKPLGARSISGLSQLPLRLRIPAGFHRLSFSGPEGCTPLPISPTCLIGPVSAACPLEQTPVCVSLSLQAEARLASALVPSHVAFEGGLTLKGYLTELAPGGQVLQVALEWAVQGPLEGDYHLFFHVVDGEGQMVTQYDNSPGGGAFSSREWQNDSTWFESFELFPPRTGKFRLYVGWYAYPQMTRLKVLSDQPGAADGLLDLGEIEVPWPGR
ncbi:MAG: hypothetical protein IAE83_00890 [Anaerolinea sp.]|nr:hypothetical protein [Anaerolinea sp.]